MKLIIIVIALVIALLVAFGASTLLSGDQPQGQQVVAPQSAAPAEVATSKSNIYVAQKDIGIGSVVTSGDFEIKSWPSHLLPPGAVIQGEEGGQVEGMIARTPIVKDEPLLLSKLRNPNDPTYIAGQLGEGMRAITVPTTLTSSVAGFVSPGDKVDVLFTFELAKGAVQGADVSSTKNAANDDKGNVAFSEVLLPNVRVLAVDARVTATAPVEGGEAPPVPASVTLEVNQRDAQKLELAQRMGNLTMLLRSVKDKDTYDIVRPIAEQDLTRILPPAYFPVLFDSDAAYDFGVVNLYGDGLSQASAKNAGVMTMNPETGKLEKKGGETGLPIVQAGSSDGEKQENTRMSVNVYRGVQLEKVEVNKP